MKNGFYAEHAIDQSAVNEHYFLHTHDAHEILLFIDGHCQFNIEGNIYDLNPYDIVIASAHELHRIIHLSSVRYERYIINIDLDFFAKHNCTHFAQTFLNHNLGKNNHINGEFALKSGMVDTIKKIQQYTAESEPEVAKCIIVELLYMIKKSISTLPPENYNSKYIQKIVAYINENLTSDLSLSFLAKKFNMSISHISNLFKKHMRMTLKNYITYKRLMYALELHKSGKTLLEASIEAGFPDYSSFYRMYVKEFKNSPRLDLKY